MNLQKNIVNDGLNGLNRDIATYIDQSSSHLESLTDEIEKDFKREKFDRWATGTFLCVNTLLLLTTLGMSIYQLTN